MVSFLKDIVNRMCFTHLHICYTIGTDKMIFGRDGFFFFKNLSFKIAMSGRVSGVVGGLPFG